MFLPVSFLFYLTIAEDKDILTHCRAPCIKLVKHTFGLWEEIGVPGKKPMHDWEEHANSTQKGPSQDLNLVAVKREHHAAPALFQVPVSEEKQKHSFKGYSKKKKKKQAGLTRSYI